MIVDKLFIDGAISIRQRYLSLIESYHEYDTIIKGLVVKIDNAMVELLEYKEKYKTNTDSNNIDEKTLSYINEVLSTIERLNAESAKIESDIEPILKGLASLAEEETELYTKMQNLYVDEAVLSDAVHQLKVALGDVES